MKHLLMTLFTLLLALPLISGCSNDMSLTESQPQPELAVVADMSLGFVVASDGLDLTPEQREKLDAAFKRFRQDVEALMKAHKEGALTREELRRKIAELELNLDAEIRSILTPEQYELWKNRQREIKQNGGVPYPLLLPLDQLARLLELTPDQVSQARIIVHNAQQALRQAVETIRDREKLKEAVEAIFQRADAQFRSLLTREQLAKYNELKNRGAQPKLPYPLPALLDQLARLLNLTPDQLEQARVVVRRAEAALKDAFGSQTDREELRATVESILQRTEAAFKAILTPEQLRTYEQWKQRGRERK